MLAWTEVVPQVLEKAACVVALVAVEALLVDRPEAVVEMENLVAEAPEVLVVAAEWVVEVVEVVAKQDPMEGPLGMLDQRDQGTCSCSDAGWAVEIQLLAPTAVAMGIVSSPRLAFLLAIGRRVFCLWSRSPLAGNENFKTAMATDWMFRFFGWVKVLT